MLFKTYLNARIFYYCSNKNVKAQILWIYDNASNLKYTFTFYYLQTSIDFLTFSLTLDKPQRLLTTFRMPIHINLDVMLVMPPTTKDLPNHLSTYTVNITSALYAFVVYVINSQFIALKPSINIPLRPLIYIYIYLFIHSQFDPKIFRFAWKIKLTWLPKTIQWYTSSAKYCPPTHMLNGCGKGVRWNAGMNT